MRPLVLTLVMLFVAGCGGGDGLPGTARELRDVCQESLAEAEEAYDVGDEAAAAAAAARAATALEKMKPLIPDGDAGAQDTYMLAADAAAGAARYATLVRERNECDARLGSADIGAYERARDVAVAAACAALADSNAEASTALAALVAPDATDSIATLYETAPNELHVALAAAHLMAGDSGLALWEIEQTEAASFADADAKNRYRLIRTVALASEGWSTLALEELKRIPRAGATIGRFTSVIMLASAWLYMRTDVIDHAERDTFRAIQIWSDNPAGPIVMAEFDAASDERAAAADALEPLVDDDRFADIADALAARTSSLRAGAAASSLLEDHDVLRVLTLAQLAAASEDETAARWAAMLEQADEVTKAVRDALASAG